MKRFLPLRLCSGLAFALLLLGLTACGTVETPEPKRESSEAMLTKASHPDLPDLGPAPELTNEVWLNVDAPLRLADLRGKVVAIDMWTFG
jgi:hypothetical protein